MTIETAANSAEADARLQPVLRKLAVAWTEFEGRLETTPLIRKLNRGTLTLADYRAFLINLRQQVVEGACWITRAASNIDAAHGELRSTLIGHAHAEHRDFMLLERDYMATGGALEEIRAARKNIGSEALSAWMYHEASKPNPFALLGAMWIIEGLGAQKASGWARVIRTQLDLPADAVRFLIHHGEHDGGHMESFKQMLAMAPMDEALEARLVRCAQVTGRLYALQLEEIDLA
jgi:hypothetical protein